MMITLTMICAVIHIAIILPAMMSRIQDLCCTEWDSIVNGFGIDCIIGKWRENKQMVGGGDVGKVDKKSFFLSVGQFVVFPKKLTAHIIGIVQMNALTVSSRTPRKRVK